MDNYKTLLTGNININFELAMVNLVKDINISKLLIKSQYFFLSLIVVSDSELYHIITVFLSNIYF